MMFYFAGAGLLVAAAIAVLLLARKKPKQQSEEPKEPCPRERFDRTLAAIALLRELGLDDHAAMIASDALPKLVPPGPIRDRPEPAEYIVTKT